MTPALGRLQGKILNARLVSYIEELGCLCNLQDGFRPGRSTLSAVARLQTYLRRAQKCHLMSVDLRRAFDLAEPRLALGQTPADGTRTGPGRDLNEGTKTKGQDPDGSRTGPQTFPPGLPCQGGCPSPTMRISPYPTGRVHHQSVDCIRMGHKG